MNLLALVAAAVAYLTRFVSASAATPDTTHEASAPPRGDRLDLVAVAADTRRWSQRGSGAATVETEHWGP